MLTDNKQKVLTWVSFEDH